MKKNTLIEPAAHQPSGEPINATSSTKSRSKCKGASAARTSKPKADPKLAKFLVLKFVPEHLVEWKRDMVLACRLAVQFPNETFWRTFSIKNQVPSMAVIYAPESRRRLKRIYEEYLKNLEKQKLFPVDEKEKRWIVAEKVGEDFIPPPKKKTLREFLQ